MKTIKTSLLNTLVGMLFSTMPLLFTGCHKQPTQAQLEQWHQEAIAQNRAILARQEQNKPKIKWQFTVQGQTLTGKPVTLSESKLNALAQTSVNTTDPHHTSNSQAVLNFRGIAVSKLLDEFGVAPNVETVTFVSYDAYRATVKVSDLRKYPIILALERNQQKIARSDGGPIYLVFPKQDFPQLQEIYPDRFWAFYVTDMIVGTESIQLQVGERFLNAANLNKLPQYTMEETVGYRIGWPANKVKLYGVRLQDVLTSAGLQLPGRGAIIVRGKSPIYHDLTNPIRIEASDVKRCNILLATHWGEERKPIPAKMGGPVTLAFSSTCQSPSDNRRWVTFVEKIELTR